MIQAADQLIQKQDDLIKQLEAEHEKMFKEKSDLQNMLEQDQTKIQAEWKNDIMWGLVGVIVGGIATAYLVKH